LSGNTVNKLRVIVSSIQKEQNTAIRKVDKKAVLIYGPAGSGKTSVGLHRLAYILYHQREQLSAKDIVILSNSNIYHSYVSGILPALCEDEVSHSIFQDILQKGLPGDIRIEGYYQQYKMLQANDGEDIKARKKLLEIKYSKEMLEFIRKYFEEYEFVLTDLKYSGQLILSAEDLSRKVARVPMAASSEDMKAWKILSGSCMRIILQSIPGTNIRKAGTQPVSQRKANSNSVTATLSAVRFFLRQAECGLPSG
jgi:DNA helicase IV